MLYAIGAGPLDDPERRPRCARRSSSAVDHGARARAQRVLENAGVHREIIVTADPALLLKPEPLPRGLLKREGLEGRRRLIGMSVREPGVAAPDLDEKVYHALLANAADFMVDRFDADVVFVPMELGARHAAQPRGDREDAARAARHGAEGRVHPGQLLSLISSFDFALGMRLHFLIFAAIAGTPFVALPYAGKVSGFLEALDLVGAAAQPGQPGRLIATSTSRGTGAARCARASARRAAAAGARARDASHRAGAPQRREKRVPTLKRPDGAPRSSCRRARRCWRARPTCWWSAAARRLGAAIGAVQAGARVILAERYGFLGGNATAALVMPLMSFHTQIPQKERRGATTLLPTDHGPGEPVVGGALAKLLARLVSVGGAIRQPLPPATWCPSIRSGSRSSRWICWTRPGCSSCSTPSPAASSARSGWRAWCSRPSPGRSRSARKSPSTARATRHRGAGRHADRGSAAPTAWCSR
jgi:hypothetical protein